MDKVTVFFNGLGLQFDVSSVAFGNVKMYGLIIAIGYSIAVVMGGMRAYKWRMNIDHMIDVAIFGTLAGIVGARAYYVITMWDIYKNNIFSIFKIWEGGLAIYGGLIGALIAALIVCRIRKLSITNLLDLCAMSFLLAQGIGRWGNFFNQEAFGCNTDSVFGMFSEKTRAYLLTHQAELIAKGTDPSIINPDLPVHPTFLYESVACIVGFIILRVICNKFRKFRGEIFALYLIWYGAERAVVEGLRTDSLYITGTNIRISQLLSAIMVLAGIIWLICGLVYARKHPLHQEIRHKKKPGEKIDWKNTAPHEPGFDVNGVWIQEGYIDPAYREHKVMRAVKLDKTEADKSTVDAAESTVKENKEDYD